MKNSILRNSVKVFLKEKNKKLSNFFKNAFKTQKINNILQNLIKKT